MVDPLAQEAADRAEDAATRAVWTADPRPDLPDHDVWRRLLAVAYARGGAGSSGCHLARRSSDF